MFRSGQLMRPVFEAAKAPPARIVYAEGEDERVLRAVQTLVDDDIAEPILIGRRAVIEQRVREMGLRIDCRESVRILDPALDAAVFDPLVAEYQHLVGRRGAPPDAAARRVRNRQTVAAALLLHAGPGRRRDLRRQRRLVAAHAVRDADHPAPRRSVAHLRALLADPAVRRAVHVRHVHERRIPRPRRSPR